ncbi:MAG: sodium/solute symporter [Pirellulales bacterium]
MPSSLLRTADWSVIALYFLVMLAIGWYYSRRSRTSEDYLVGGRNMNSYAIGLSLFATLVSSLSYLAMPGEMIRYGPIFLTGLLAFPLIVGIVGWQIVPRIMRLRVTSAYEILEARFGLTVRLVGSSFFLAMRLLWMAVIVYATSREVLVPILGIDPSATPLICLIMGLTTVAYTTAGGLKAVVATDVAQSLIMVTGAMLAIGLITWRTGGIDGWWPQAWPEHWPPLTTGHDAGSQRSVLAFIVNAITWYVCTACSDQMAIQRYLATRDARAAQRAFATSMVADGVMAVLLGLFGLALLGYGQFDSSLLTAGGSNFEHADQILPHFIVSGLPGGLGGLIIAALLAAAMSSLSSGLSSSGSVVTVDFLDRLGAKSLSDAQHLRRAHYASLVIGIVVVVLSWYVGIVPGNLFELVNKTVNLLVGPLAGLFILAMFVPRATTFGALVGTVAAVIVVVVINHWEPLSLLSERWTGVASTAPFVSFLWATPVAVATQVGLGALASRLPIGPPPRTMASLMAPTPGAADR